MLCKFHVEVEHFDAAGGDSFRIVPPSLRNARVLAIFAILTQISLLEGKQTQRTLGARWSAGLEQRHPLERVEGPTDHAA